MYARYAVPTLFFGFLMASMGLTFLCQVLAEHGFTETAYRLLLQDTCPGWLYAVEKGATTNVSSSPSKRQPLSMRPAGES